jgi:Skp family chaperone for outer membrane proteins
MPVFVADDDDPPAPDVDDQAQAITLVPAVITDPAALIPGEAILRRMEGITAADRARALLLGQQALSIRLIDSDELEVLAARLIDDMAAHQAQLEGKVRPFSDLAHKLHRALTGFLGSATADLTAGLAHLKPMLARRLRAKQEAEEARQRDERERARKAEQDRLLAEAAHAEQLGESPETVQQILEEAESVPAPVVAERPITTVRGASTRDNWKCEVVDKRQLVLHVAERLRGGDESLLNLLDVSTTTANQLARAQKSTMRIPGLRAVNDVAFTKRRSA